MDWKVFWATFATIFLSELGDKTQLGVLSFSASTRSPRTVFLAASLALVFSTLIAAAAGTVLARYLQPKTLKWVGGCLFIAVGAWILMKGD